MTRTFDTLVQCPQCGHEHTAETAMERWIRGHPQLDSREAGIVRFDIDILLHRYMIKTDWLRGTRTLQCMMFIEVKTHGANVTPSQQDTLSALSQIMRNRRANRHAHKRGRHAADHVPPSKVWSIASKKKVRLRLYGGHLLRLSDVDPPSSEWITWDNKPIDVETLVKLLRFDLDPDTLREADWRRRSYRRADVDDSPMLWEPVP